MGMIINIDEALKLRTDYNVLKEPLNRMMMDQQEAWEKQNPIDLLFVRNTIGGFQETFTSSIGFDHAFTETSDFNVGPIFNTAEGFATTYRTRTFQGGFIITQQAMEDRAYGKIKDDASAFIKRWHGDQVEYALKSLDGAFAAAHTSPTATTWNGGDGKTTLLKLESADTTDGDITTATKTSLFNKSHYCVKRGNDTPLAQSNFFGANAEIKLDGTDALYIGKLADFINQVICEMENYKDDNGKRAGVLGQKTIVCYNNPHLAGALKTAVSLPEINGIPNPAYQRAVVETTPYLGDVDCTKDGKSFFVIDRAYNEANHGLEMTERIPFTLDVNELKRPNGIAYDGRQRFDINVATWRGAAFCWIGASNASKAYSNSSNYKSITPVAVGKPVAIVSPTDATTGSVKTKADA